MELLSVDAVSPHVSALYLRTNIKTVNAGNLDLTGDRQTSSCFASADGSLDPLMGPKKPEGPRHGTFRSVPCPSQRNRPGLLCAFAAEPTDRGQCRQTPAESRGPRKSKTVL